MFLKDLWLFAAPKQHSGAFKRREKQAQAVEPTCSRAASDDSLWSLLGGPFLKKFHFIFPALFINLGIKLQCFFDFKGISKCVL